MHIKYKGQIGKKIYAILDTKLLFSKTKFIKHKQTPQIGSNSWFAVQSANILTTKQWWYLTKFINTI